MDFVCENLQNLIFKQYLNSKLNSDFLKRFITKFGSRNIPLSHFWIYKKRRKNISRFSIFSKVPTLNNPKPQIWPLPSSSPQLPKKLKTYIQGELSTLSSEIKFQLWKFIFVKVMARAISSFRTKLIFDIFEIKK